MFNFKKIKKYLKLKSQKKKKKKKKKKYFIINFKSFYLFCYINRHFILYLFKTKKFIMNVGSIPLQSSEFI